MLVGPAPRTGSLETSAKSVGRSDGRDRTAAEMLKFTRRASIVYGDDVDETNCGGTPSVRQPIEPARRTGLHQLRFNLSVSIQHT